VLNYKVIGDGDVIVFLHGFLESISMWNYLPLEELKGKKVFIDLPGHGKSKLIENFSTPSMRYLADEVVSVLTHLNVVHFSIVGHSMGGYIALLIKQQISHCQKVVLLNSNFWSDSEQKKKDRIRIADIAFKAKSLFLQESIPNLFGNPKNFQNEIEKLKFQASKMSSEAIAYSSLAMRERNDFTTEINSNPADYYFIQGIDDKLNSVNETVSKVKNKAQLFLIENAGHMAHIEAKTKVMELLCEIL
jgi:pimeloyl-ACP methyl ester carboxylesterase